jgi:ketosteroid isomerase-like protein
VRTASPEIIEQCRHGFECWNRRELDEMMESYAPDAEVDLSRVLPDEDIVRGRVEIRAYLDRIWHAWGGFSWTPQEIVDLGDDSYAVVTRIDAEGRSSGIPVRTEFTIVYSVIDGLIARAVYYPGGKAELEAAQLQG